MSRSGFLRTLSQVGGESCADAQDRRNAPEAAGVWKSPVNGAPKSGRRVVRLLETIRIQALYPKCSLSQPGDGHRSIRACSKASKYQVRNRFGAATSRMCRWPADSCTMYLVATMDWRSRYAVGWDLSNILDSDFFIQAWQKGLETGLQPLISNTDQGCQFTSEAYMEAVVSPGVDVGMDGRGGWIDNRFIRRIGCAAGLLRRSAEYNQLRPHQSMGDATPGELYPSPES